MSVGRSTNWPSRPLPPVLFGHETGTWQHDTVSRRLGTIAQRVLAENSLSPSQEQRLHTLIAELPHGAMRPLMDPKAPDAADWSVYVEPYLGRSWLDVPWFFAEMAFFRRILEATGYFGPGPGEGRDPYRHQKLAGLADAAAAAGVVAESALRDYSASALAQLLRIDLWGNQADQSIWPLSLGEGATLQSERPNQGRLLIDDLSVVAGYLERVSRQRRARVDFLIDNTGVELAGDLMTADFLLRHGIAARVTFHVKPYPTFVSDATVPDVVAAIEHLAGQDSPDVAGIGWRLRRFLSEGSLALGTHAFWTSPLAFWELPDDLRRQLAPSDLLIVKGDMNYRRLHGDRHWPFDTPFGDIVRGSPAPIVALRVLKAEVASGLDAQQVAEVAAMDPAWMTNGRWGMAPFYPDASRMDG